MGGLTNPTQLVLDIGILHDILPQPMRDSINQKPWYTDFVCESRFLGKENGKMPFAKGETLKESMERILSIYRMVIDEHKADDIMPLMDSDKRAHWVSDVKRKINEVPEYW